MKQFVGYLVKKALGKGKVSPTIKSVKPFTDKKFSRFGFDKAKNPTERANIVRKRESIKRMDQLDNLKKKRKEGIKAGKEIKRMVDTGRAKNIGGSVFHKGIPEKKASGGRVGRRFGSPNPKKTNVEKIKETFAPKGKNLKPVDPKKQKGLSKLPRQVRNKMGYMKSGGRAGFRDGTPPTGTKSGGTRPRQGTGLFDPNNPMNKRKKNFKQEAKEDMK